MCRHFLALESSVWWDESGLAGSEFFAEQSGLHPVVWGKPTWFCFSFGRTQASVHTKIKVARKERRPG